jgi:DNA replication protein DnaC
MLVREGDRAVAKICSCSQQCAVCGGSGYIYVKQEEEFSRKVGKREYEVLAPCSCRLLKRRVGQLGEAGIPGVLAQASFESFRSFNEAQDAARRSAFGFAQGYSKGGGSKGFILSGPVGTGKSHLLVSALTYLALELGVQVRYQEISLLFATIRRGFQEGKSGGEIIGPLSEVEVLAIDELGKGRGSPFEMETLDELIARRYNAGRTTLFATNFALDPERRGQRSVRGYVETEELEKAGKDSKLLRDRVGERIYSRLCEMCEFVQLPPDTPDQRRMRQELRTGAAERR